MVEVEAMIKRVLAEVRSERERQVARWGQQDWAPIVYLGVLAEEFGEASKEAVEATFAPDASVRQDSMRRMRAELIQVAAVAVAMVEALDRQAEHRAPVIWPSRPELTKHLF